MGTDFRTFALSGAIAVTLGLAGCTSAATPPKSPSTSPHPTASGSASEITLDPLSEYLYVDMSDYYLEQNEAEEIIQKCMEDQGFRYTPYVSEAQPDDKTLELPPQLRPDRDWVKAHGWGYVETAFLPPDYTAEPDPDDAYLDSLSAAERSAYDKALYGKSLTHDSSELSADERGCNGKGADHTGRDQSTKPPIIDDAQDLLDSLTTSPEVGAVFAADYACLQDAGYSPSIQWDFYAKVEAYSEAHPDTTSEDPDVLDLKAEEIEIALVGWDCQEKNDTLNRYLTTLTDLEQDYIAAHKKELEEARLWLNG